MKKLFCLFLVSLIFSGCALTTIKPYKKEATEREPVKKSIIESIIKPAPAVKEEAEEIK